VRGFLQIDQAPGTKADDWTGLADTSEARGPQTRPANLAFLQAAKVVGGVMHKVNSRDGGFPCAGRQAMAESPNVAIAAATSSTAAALALVGKCGCQLDAWESHGEHHVIGRGLDHFLPMFLQWQRVGL
jgi:hypothetical protein